MHLKKVHEVACLCFPNSSRKTAVTRLRRWIVADKELYEALLRKGYRKGQRRFTKSQTNVIKRLIGM